jgi:hypothetical protein
LEQERANNEMPTAIGCTTGRLRILGAVDMSVPAFRDKVLDENPKPGRLAHSHSEWVRQAEYDPPPGLSTVGDD